jgi:ubiquinone/menaquinone biosynthesis C-methylase UbiE
MTSSFSASATEQRRASWNQLFQSREWGKYPSEELIRFIARSFPDVSQRKDKLILDLGCGTGACAWYLGREGFTAHAIDGSERAIEIARARIENEGYQDRITCHVGGMEDLPFESNTFDAVIDIGAITANPWADCLQIIDGVYRVMKPGGLYFGSFLAPGTSMPGAPFISECGLYGKHDRGPLADAQARLFSFKEMQDLFAAFTDFSIDRHLRTLNNQQYQVEHWDVSVRKPE